MARTLGDACNMPMFRNAFACRNDIKRNKLQYKTPNIIKYFIVHTIKKLRKLI